MVSFYIYYRVAADRMESARNQIDRLQDRLARDIGVRGRLLTKRGEPDLWMEIYEDVAEAARFEHALQGAVEALCVDELLAAGSRRHVECFECA